MKSIVSIAVWERVALTVCLLVSTRGLAVAQALAGVALYEQHCATCHSASAADSRAPDRQTLKQRTPESILESLTSGSMAVNAMELSESDRRLLAETLASRPLGSAASGAVAAMSNTCANRPAESSTDTRMWSGWGADVRNTRFEPNSGLTVAQIPRLTLKWAFGFPNSTSAFAQPAVAGGRVFVGSENGFVYSLDLASGCAYWSFEAKGSVRTAISVGRIGSGPAQRDVVYFGDLKANVYAVDARSGAEIWSARADSHALACITGSPTLADGRLYVPLSSVEESAGANPNYQCCTFRGGVVAYDAASGHEIWRSYAIPSPPKALKKNSLGTQLWGPAGAAIWSAPTVDRKRGLLYAATGNAYTEPAAEQTDAVVAFDLKTGRLRWSKQLTANDAFVLACDSSPTRENCPAGTGRDFDFGSSPMLRDLVDGRSILTIGQKSGVAWGLDPDKDGEVVWQQRLGRGGGLGGIEWGGAADQFAAYYPIADAAAGPAGAGGIHALRLSNGGRLWSWRPSAATCTGRSPCVQAHSAAITVMPGVVFAGTTNGWLRAHSARSGTVLWEFNTARDFKTVNGVPAKGGSINGPGPVVAGGMLLTNSGYSYLGIDVAGNVLLAFGVD